MDFDVKTENFEKTRLSIVKLAVWLVYNAFLILYNGYRMMWVSKVPNYDARVNLHIPGIITFFPDNPSDKTHLFCEKEKGYRSPVLRSHDGYFGNLLHLQ